MGIFKYKLRLLTRTILKKGVESKAKLIVGLIVISIFSGGGFLLFYQIFNYLKDVQDIGTILADRLIGVGFLGFALMLFISNIVSAISTLYTSTETHFFISSPISHRRTFWIKFLDNLFFSSWATAVIGVPLFLAYSFVFDIPWYYFLTNIFLSLPAFLLIPAYFGAGLSIVFFIAAERFGYRRVLTGAVLLGVISIFFYIKQNKLTGILFSIRGDLNVLNYYLQSLASSNSVSFTPWDWLANSLKFARWHDFEKYVTNFSLLMSSCFLGGLLLDWFADAFYYRAFLASGETISKRRKKRKKYKLYGGTWKFFSPFQKDIRSLLVKDIKLFVRDPSQWMQFGVLLVLLGVYLVNLRHVPMRVGSEALQLTISFANYGFCGYILATLSVRFVYPSISMEGRSFWLVRSSPTPVAHIFWEKFYLAFGIFFIIAETVAVISNGILSQSRWMMFLTGGGIFFMSFSLVSLSVGLGILFPDFEEANPGKIASSGGGMITALLSLIYVGLSVVILAWPTKEYIAHLTQGRAFPTNVMIIGGVLMLVLNLAATLIPLYLGVREIKKLEY